MVTSPTSPAPVERLVLEFDYEVPSPDLLREALETNVRYELGSRLLALLQPGTSYVVRLERHETPGQEWYGDMVRVRYVVEVQEQECPAGERV